MPVNLTGSNSRHSSDCTQMSVTVCPEPELTLVELLHLLPLIEGSNVGPLPPVWKSPIWTTCVLGRPTPYGTYLAAPAARSHQMIASDPDLPCAVHKLPPSFLPRVSREIRLPVPGPYREDFCPLGFLGLPAIKRAKASACSSRHHLKRVDHFTDFRISLARSFVIVFDTPLGRG